MEKYFHFDRNKTLEELDGEDWGFPAYNSHLVTTCHDLRSKPVGNFSVEDLRIMIGQKLSLEYLIPLALEILEDNIYPDEELYPSVLLNTVLNVGRDFWISNPDYKNDLETIIVKNIEDLESKLDSFRHSLI